MRFSERTRRWAIRLAWAGLLVAVSLLVGLRLGRPLYYTDGSRQVAATTLIAGGMVRWNTPEAVAELPGPVQGRVAELADGRLVYGRSTADGTTDLVVFDPRRPALPPEPAYGLNTAHNELAPALAADGRLYFASDRPEGVGGYDLYVAAPGPAGFGAPVPVTICNSALDETDPAPHPDGDELVFVRIDRRVAAGRGGELWQVRLGAGFDPTPVFAAPGRRRAAWSADRDPAFAAGGNALWFVRQAAAAAPELLRASRLGDRYDAPQPVGSAWGTRNLRAPLPSADGLHLSLLQPRSGNGDADLWFCATAEELPPWWPGQRWLEGILVGAAGVCALLLLLLHLGRRWSALDLVAQCLLLSLLLHVLVFLWLMGVEIAGSPLPGDADAGRLQVMVVPMATSAAASEGPSATDVAARVVFADGPRPLEVRPPSAAPAAVARALAVTDRAAQWTAQATAGAVDAQTPLQDRAAEGSRRSEVAAANDPEAAPTPEPQPGTTAAAAAGAATRAADAAAVIMVAVPAVAVPSHTAPRQLLTAAVAPPLARARPMASPGSAVQDAAAAPPVREASDAPVAVEAAPATIAMADPAAPATHRPASDGEAALARALPPRAPLPVAPLPAASVLALTAPAALPTTQPAAREHAAAAPLRDLARGPDVPALVRADERPAAAVAPVATDARASHAAAVEVARGAAAASAPPPMAVPASHLARAAAAPPLPAAGLPAPTAATTLGATARATVAVRDRAATERGPALGAPAAAAVAVAPADEPTATGMPRAAEFGGPARGLARPPAVDRVPLPGSQLTRRKAAPELVRGAMPGRPVATASATGVLTATRVLDRDTAAAPVVAGTASQVPPMAASGPRRAGASPPVAPPGAAALATPARAGMPPATRPAEPPGSLLARAARGLDAAARPAAEVPLPRARTLGARTAVADAPRAGARPAPSPPVVAGVPAAAVRLEPQPVQWPTLRRASRPEAATEAPFAAAPPGSLLARQQTTTALPPQLADPAPRNAYSNRFGPAKARALETFGGSEATERAVADGLRYLARLQNADGTWGDRSDFDTKYGFVYVGKTALCVLAFLGAGHTPTSRSEHSGVVQKALEHLLSLQDPDTGAFGASSCYGHGITTYALAECYGLTKSPALLRPLEHALAWIVEHQGPRRDRRNRGGWGYYSPGLAAEDDYARVSVTAWMVMALESARLSGIELPETVLPRAREFLDLAFDQKNGWFRYNHEPGRLRSAWPTLPASTPAGAFCLMLLGAGAEDHKVQAAVDYTVARRPEQYRPYDDEEFVLRGQGNVYFWYYGSLCCFLAGGDAWQRWNERLRTVLPAAQSPDGSFAPIDVYAHEAGDSRTDRSYTTAMCVLSLEVYYRYFTPLLLGR
ncbi:MAG: PD40 domain-containing protein [Planctomycetes bacterium]|nr:PD40 domain-containing protein [Planctomycetota bacterium]